MKIGLVAMSGVRVANPKLLEVGLSLPGFVERSKVIASLPSLGLLTLAALTPPDIEVEYHEVRDLGDEDRLPRDFDLVAISSFSAQIREAYQIAEQFECQATPVVMGGLHVTALPDEAAHYCTSVAVGEGEITWPRIVQDLRRGTLQPRYEAVPGERFDLAEAPMPRFNLLDVDRYNRLTVQTTRGCPHRCEFCASSVMLGSVYRVKPVDKVVAEVRRIKELWPDPFLEFADDNSFAVRRHAIELLEALRRERVRWFTEVDIGIADRPEVLELMRESGCRQVLIGLESLTSSGLDGLDTRNWKLHRLGDYQAAVARIQAAGIAVIGCFILGLDGDTEAVFDQVYQFADETALFDVQLTVQTPFPGTALYERLRREGRLLEEEAWERCTLFDVNYVPQNMSPEVLQQGLLDLGRRVYEPAFVKDRRKRFFQQRRKYRSAHHEWADAEWEAALA